MTDRKEDIAWLGERLREIERKNGRCECGRGPLRSETEMCQSCEDDAQANVVDLDAADIKAWGG